MELLSKEWMKTRRAWGVKPSLFWIPRLTRRQISSTVRATWDVLLLSRTWKKKKRNCSSECTCSCRKCKYVSHFYQFMNITRREESKTPFKEQTDCEIPSTFLLLPFPSSSTSQIFLTKTCFKPYLVTDHSKISFSIIQMSCTCTYVYLRQPLTSRAGASRSGTRWGERNCAQIS